MAIVSGGRSSRGPTARATRSEIPAPAAIPRTAGLRAFAEHQHQQIAAARPDRPANAQLRRARDDEIGQGTVDAERDQHRRQRREPREQDREQAGVAVHRGQDFRHRASEVERRRAIDGADQSAHVGEHHVTVSPGADDERYVTQRRQQRGRQIDDRERRGGFARQPHIANHTDDVGGDEASDRVST